MGKTIEETTFIDKITSRFARARSVIRSADATGFLPGKQRFFVYIKADPPGVSAEKPQRLILQHIDATTGDKIGEGIELYRDEEIFPNVKIDQAGRFVLFFVNFIEFGSLDSQGRPSDLPRVLTSISGGIDLLRVVE